LPAAPALDAGLTAQADPVPAQGEPLDSPPSRNAAQSDAPLPDETPTASPTALSPSAPGMAGGVVVGEMPGTPGAGPVSIGLSPPEGWIAAVTAWRARSCTTRRPARLC
jgi:hypothetical protein